MARNFNGTTDKITVPAGAGINNLQTWTAWAWVRYASLNAASNQYVSSKNGTDRVYLQFGNIAGGTSALGANVGRATTASSYRSPSSAVATNTWTFVAVNFDDSRGAGARFAMFIGTTPSNLASVAVTAFTEGTGAINDDTAGSLCIGGRTTDNLRDWSGDIGKTGLTSALLSSAELQAIMNDSLPTSADAPAAYWLLNETGSPTTATDSSGNAHNGTYSGTTAASSDPPTDTVAGPSSGTTSVESTAYTVTLAFAADVSGVTVNLASNGSGDVFHATSGGSTVTSIAIASGLTTGTFYYVPGSNGTWTITPTATGIGFVPATLSYAASGGAAPPPPIRPPFPSIPATFLTM